jgi:hypothetical protein
MARTKSILLAAASIALTAPAYLALQAGPANAAGCGIYANVPYPLPGEMAGSGGRSGCSTSRQISIDLRWDRPFSPDPSLDSRSGVYVNVNFKIGGSCLAGTHGYYDEIDGAAGHLSSDQRSISVGEC